MAARHAGEKILRCWGRGRGMSNWVRVGAVGGGVGPWGWGRFWARAAWEEPFSRVLGGGGRWKQIQQQASC